MNAHKSGFVTMIGRPNVGKSTLINALIGQKIAIISDKPQTTRSRILCILTEEDAQIIFLDTPGVHKPHHKLGAYMARATESALHGVDVVVFVVDATEKMGAGEQYILKQLADVHVPVLLAVNKIDRIARAAVLPIIASYTGAYDFAGVVPISARDKINLEGLREEIKKHLPHGPRYYPEDMVTDQPERHIIAELIREKALELTRDEIPHAIAVDIEEMTTRPKGDVYIRAVLYVERTSQKGILIGAGGRLLRTIGARARADAEMLLEAKVFLDLWVKTRKDWRESANALREFGFREED
jgi:GTP-binding protein era